jgi:hypothetical protein
MGREKLNHEQFKLRLPADLVRELNGMANKYNHGTAQDVVKRVLADCLKWWEQAEIIRQRAIEEKGAGYVKDATRTELPSPRGRKNNLNDEDEAVNE